MKTKVLIPLIFTCLITSVHSQNYVPFPNGVASWTTSYCNNISQQTGDYRLALAFDTLINGVSYNKIFHSTEEIFDIDSTVYFAALREENQQIFYIPADSNTEYMLYDFTKEVGDTVTIYAFDHNPVDGTGSPEERSLTVDAIDSVMVLDGTYRKRYYFAINGLYHLDEYWIEGMGSTFGLFQPLLSSLDTEMHLRCFIAAHEFVYYEASPTLCGETLPNNIQCSDYVISVEDVEETIEENFKIYPNPVSNILTIEIENNQPLIRSLALYNQLGQPVCQINTGLDQQHFINIESLEKGMYYLQVENIEAQTFIAKVIVD